LLDRHAKPCPRDLIAGASLLLAGTAQLTINGQAVADGPLVVDKWDRAGSSKTVVAFNVALLPVA
jgi:hypothetical protein